MRSTHIHLKFRDISLPSEQLQIKKHFFVEGSLQTCSLCQTQSYNSAYACSGCGADLRQYSTAAVALKRYQENPRVIAIQIATAREACPACQAVAGTYAKDLTPALPVEGCSNFIGCNCFYQPLLDEIYP